MNDENLPWYKTHGIPIVIVGATLIWTVVVLASGLDYNLFNKEWKFDRTAQLGDSFGVVGGIMATLAAAFTFITLREERAEVRRLRHREVERDKSDQKRETETTFFQLLELRNSIISNIVIRKKYGGEMITYSGQQALVYYQERLDPGIERTFQTHRVNYEGEWKRIGMVLGHYLRFTYHIIKFAHERFADERVAYEYIRLLRSQLSDAELTIIALNSMHGAGYPEMTKFINHYGLLHSLPKDLVSHLHLKTVFNDEAFDTAKWSAVRTGKALPDPKPKPAQPKPEPIASGPL